MPALEANERHSLRLPEGRRLAIVRRASVRRGEGPAGREVTCPRPAPMESIVSNLPSIFVIDPLVNDPTCCFMVAQVAPLKVTTVFADPVELMLPVHKDTPR